MIPTKDDILEAEASCAENYHGDDSYGYERGYLAGLISERSYTEPMLELAKTAMSKMDSEIIKKWLADYESYKFLMNGSQ